MGFLQISVLPSLSLPRRGSPYSSGSLQPRIDRAFSFHASPLPWMPPPHPKHLPWMRPPPQSQIPTMDAAASSRQLPLALLDMDVRLVASTGEKTGGGGSMTSFVREEDIIGGSSRPLNDTVRWALGIDSEDDDKPTGLVDWVRQGTVELVVDDTFGPPPLISTVSLHLPATPREITAHMESVRVLSADGNLLVLSTGPRLYGFASSGQCLVYDADAKSLLAVPHMPYQLVRVL
ncbi:hypothetical protein ACP4OV_015388 [Aristida adscensionis]